MEGFEPILEAMGYRYDNQTQLYKLDKDIRLNPRFDDKIALIGCELLLAYEELNLYEEMSKNYDYDPIKHFIIFIQPSQTSSAYTPPLAQQEQPYAPYEPNPRANPINYPGNMRNMPDMQDNTQPRQLNPYPDSQAHGYNTSNQEGQGYGRTLPHNPGQQTGQSAELEVEVDVYPNHGAHGMQTYNQPHGVSKLDERGLSQGVVTDSRFDAYRQPGMMDQRNALPQNINIDQRGLGGVGTGTSRYTTISTVNQGKQDIMPTEMVNYADREANYQGRPQDVYQTTGRGLIGKEHQGVQGHRQDMNPQGSRDGMRTQDQGYPGQRQDMNPQGFRDGMGTQDQGYPGQRHDINPHGSKDGMGTQDQGYPGQRQDMNPQGSRDGMGTQDQGYPGQRHGINPHGSKDGMGTQDQGYPGQRQDMNPQGFRDGMGTQDQGYVGQHQDINPHVSRSGMGTQDQGYLGQRHDMNPHGPKDGMGTQDQGYQGQRHDMNPHVSRDEMGIQDQGYQGQRHDMNPHGPKDGMGTQDQVFQGQHQDMNRFAERDVIRGQVQGSQGRTEYSAPTNLPGEYENIQKPAIGPKPTASGGTNPVSANITPRPYDSSFAATDLPANLDRYNGVPLSIHSENPRNLPMRPNDAEIPNTALREQQAKVSTCSDPFQSQAFDKHHNSGLHGTIPTADTEQRTSQEQQHLSGEQKHFSGHQERLSGQQMAYTDVMNTQDTNYPREKQIHYRASEQNIVMQRIDSPPYQPLPKQISENTLPGSSEQRGGAIPQPLPHQQQYEQRLQFEETQMPYGVNPAQYRQEFGQNQPNYNQQATYNDNYQRLPQEQNMRCNQLIADIDQRMQNVYIKEVPPMQYQQYPDTEHRQMGDFRHNQRGDPGYNFPPPHEHLRQDMPAIDPYQPHNVQHYKATGESYPPAQPGSYPTDNTALYNQPYKGVEFEATKGPGPMYNPPPQEMGMYPFEDHRQQLPYVYEENMPFPHTKQDFSRPVGPNPNPRERPDPRYHEAQRGGQEAYNAPDMYPGQRREPEYYGQNPPPCPQPHVPEIPRQYGDPHMAYPPDMGYPPRQELGDEFHRIPDLDRRMDLPEDRVSMQDRMARFQHNPIPAPPMQQQQFVSDKPWSCPHCTYVNQANKKVCEICSKTPDFELAPNQSVPTHKRMCPFCKELNSIDARACSGCGRNFVPLTN